jgi:hypothetical protein
MNNKFLIKGAGLVRIIESLLKYPITILKGMKQSKRYVVITPAFMINQVIFDKKVNKLVFLKIRDWIDFLTLKQIFQAEDYGLSRFK